MFTTQNQKIVPVMEPKADRFAGNSYTTGVHLNDYDHACFIIMNGAGATGTVLVKAVARAGNGSLDAKVIIPFRYREMTTIDTWGKIKFAKVAGVTPDAGVNRMLAVEIDTAELPEGYPWISLLLAEATDSPVDGAVVCILTGGRYSGEDLPSVI